jgi:hypothetical protein
MTSITNRLTPNIQLNLKTSKTHFTHQTLPPA